jgi:transcription initiation factor IIE alpha subunit
MVAKVKRERCPYCSKMMNERDYTSGIKNLSLSRSKKTMECIEDVFKIIGEARREPIRQAEYFMLLNEINDVIGIVVRKTIQQFKDKKHAESGHNIRYLLAMIKGENSAHSLRENYERKTLDRLPPVKEKE